MFQGKRLCLILDQYGAHINPQVRDYANSLNIRMVFVPKGATSFLQPLDRRVFGQMKLHARSIWQQKHRLLTDVKDNKITGAMLAYECWNMISETTLLEAFNLHEYHGIQVNEEINSDDIDPDTDSWDPTLHNMLR